MKHTLDFIQESEYLLIDPGQTGNQLLEKGPCSAHEITGDEILDASQSDNFLNITEKSDEVDGIEFTAMESRNTLKFRTNSAKPDRKGTPTFYNQKIKAPAFDDVFDGMGRDDVPDDDDLDEFIELAVFDEDIKVLCSDPSFKFWGYSYFVSQTDAKVGPEENRFPDDRNPDLEGGGACKHLFAVLEKFKNTNEMDDDIREAVAQQIRAGKFK